MSLSDDESTNLDSADLKPRRIPTNSSQISPNRNRSSSARRSTSKGRKANSAYRKSETSPNPEGPKKKWDTTEFKVPYF